MKLFINPEKEKKIEEKAKQSFDEMPVGKYGIRIEEISMIEDADGTERGFSFKFAVMEPDAFKTRFLWKNVYLKNKEGDETKELTMLGMFSNFLDQCGIAQEQRSELYKKLSSEEGLVPADLMALFDGRYLTVQTANVPMKDKSGTVTGSMRSEIKKVLDVKDDSNAFK